MNYDSFPCIQIQNHHSAAMPSTPSISEPNIQIAHKPSRVASIANNAKQINLNISRIFDISVNYSQKIIKTKQYSLKASFANIIFAVYHPPVTSEANKFVIAKPTAAICLLCFLPFRTIEILF